MLMHIFAVYLVTTSRLSVINGQNMQLTGCHNMVMRCAIQHAWRHKRQRPNSSEPTVIPYIFCFKQALRFFSRFYTTVVCTTSSDFPNRETVDNLGQFQYVEFPSPALNAVQTIDNKLPHQLFIY